MMHLSELLGRFKNVTELTFVNKFDKYLTFMEIQKIFPNLVTFRFETDYMSDDELSYNIDTSEEYQFIGTDDSAIHINRKLRFLEILAPIPLCHVKYLIKYLPDQLEKITLNIRDTDLYVWINKIGETNILQSMEQLRRVNEVDIFFINEQEPVLLEPIDVSNITKYFKVAKTLIGDREIDYLLVTNLSITNNHFKRDSSGRVELEYIYNTQRDFKKKRGAVEFNVPDEDISGINLKVIKRMDFIYGNVITKSHPNTVSGVLRYIAQNCPALEFFRLEFRGLYLSELILSPIGEQKAESINDLKAVKLVNIAKHEKTIETMELFCIESMHIEFAHYTREFDEMYFRFRGQSFLKRCYFYAGVARLVNTRYLMIYMQDLEAMEMISYCYDAREKRMVAQEMAVFIDSNVPTSSVTFVPEKSLRITLYDEDVGVVAVFINRELLSLDYPFELDFY